MGSRLRSASTPNVKDSMFVCREADRAPVLAEGQSMCIEHDGAHVHLIRGKPGSCHRREVLSFRLTLVGRQTYG